MTELDQRNAVVLGARRWIATPYHHRAAVLGGGIDCAQIILEAHISAGLVERFKVDPYNHDWHMHRNEEAYLEVLGKYLHEEELYSGIPFVDRPSDYSVKPGDVVIWRKGRTYSHGAIVSTWPNVIHSYFPARMVEEVSIRGTPMSKKLMKVFSYWGFER